MSATTTHGWTLPTVGADSDVWGTELNANISAQDAILSTGNLSVAAWTTSAIRLRLASATYTDTSSSGTVATVYVDANKAATLAASAATTFTNAYGAYFENPVAGTNVTITTAWALGADSAKIAGNLSAGGTLSVTGISTLTAGLLSYYFSQAAAVSGTFYTAITNAQLVAAGGQSGSNTFDVTIISAAGATSGIYRVTYNALVGGLYNIATIQAGSSLTVQFDGSNNFQVKQASGGAATIGATIIRIPM